MTDFEHVQRVPRRRAAEHLVDIAYALTGGERLELRHEDEQFTVAVADEVLMMRRSTSTGDRVEVTIELSWSHRTVTTPRADGDDRHGATA